MTMTPRFTSSFPDGHVPEPPVAVAARDLFDPVLPVSRVADPAPVLQRVVAVCNGDPRSDSTPRLADAIARATGASVRAVAWLPAELRNGTASPFDAPVEVWLHRINRQLRRTTADPGEWRVSLLVGDAVRGLVRTCHEERADLILVPAAECAERGATLQSALAAGIPVACVDDEGASAAPRVVLCAGPEPRSQQAARLVAAVLAALRSRS